MKSHDKDMSCKAMKAPKGMKHKKPIMKHSKEDLMKANEHMKKHGK